MFIFLLEKEYNFLECVLTPMQVKDQQTKCVYYLHVFLRRSISFLSISTDNCLERLARIEPSLYTVFKK